MHSACLRVTMTKYTAAASHKSARWCGARSSEKPLAGSNKNKTTKKGSVDAAIACVEGSPYLAEGGRARACGKTSRMREKNEATRDAQGRQGSRQERKQSGRTNKKGDRKHKNTREKRARV
jgi:hypothetical protein